MNDLNVSDVAAGFSLGKPYTGATAPTPGGLEPARGAAQPPLDLSLGHIRKTEELEELDIVSFGPYQVTLDYGAMLVEVAYDKNFISSRGERRKGARKVEKLLKTVTETGMHVEGWPL